MITLYNESIFRKIIEVLTKTRILRFDDLEKIIPELSKSDLELVLGTLISEGILREVRIMCNNCNECSFKFLCPIPKPMRSEVRFFILTKKSKKLLQDI